MPKFPLPMPLSYPYSEMVFVITKNRLKWNVVKTKKFGPYIGAVSSEEKILTELSTHF